MSSAAERMLAQDGPVARRLEGFESRPQQVEMAAAVDDATGKQQDLVRRGRNRNRKKLRISPAGDSTDHRTA